MKLSFKAKVWLYPGASAAWHFVSLPKPERDLVRKLQAGVKRRGWGTIKVTARIGKETWQTSIFPDKKSDTYLLPLKASVRKVEGIMQDDTVKIVLKI